MMLSSRKFLMSASTFREAIAFFHCGVQCCSFPFLRFSFWIQRMTGVNERQMFMCVLSACFQGQPDD